MKIGLIGAYGHNDLGDEAMLLAWLDFLERNGIKYKIISENPDRLDKLLNLKVTEDLSKDFYGIYGNKYFSYILKLFQKMIMGDITPIKKLIKGNPTIPSEDKFLLKKTTKIFKDIESNRLNEYNSAINKLKDVDLLLVIGGGYFNSRWSSLMYHHLLTIKLASQIDIPVLLSGQTIGPLNEKDAKLVSKSLESVEAIGVRDPYSVQILKKKINFNKSIFRGPDDALFLNKDSKNNLNEYTKILIKKIRILLLI